MASQYQSAITRQEERDHRLAILIQQQETLVARQLSTKPGSHHIDQHIDAAIRNSLLSSSSNTQSEDLETDGLSTGQRSSLDPLLTSFPLTGTNSLPQVKGQSVPLMSSRRARRFDPLDSSHCDNHVMGLSDEHTVLRQTSPVDGTASYLSDPDSSDQSDEDEHFNEIRNTVPSNFNENERTLSAGDEQNLEIQGASNYLERRRSFGNEDEDEISREIEELMNIGAISKSEAESIQESQQRKFRLNNMTKWQRNNEDEEMRPFVFDTDGIPINWTDEGELTNQRQGQSMDVRLVELQPGQIEYDKIDDEFKETGIEITKIERIQNTYLLDRFKAEMESTARRRHSGFDLNIRYLYHGTKADKDRIGEEGLDQRLSRMGYFGKGIYFSDNPLKCVYYTENMDGLGDAYILKCRVILGDSKCFAEGQYDTSLKREPEKENVQPGMWRFYDSVVGCPKDYNEFVVYENRRAMIEYIISFKVGPEVAAVMQQLNTASAFVGKKQGGEGEPFDDNHLDRIRQVREAVRRKRCQNRGITYMEPNQQKKQQDDHMWNKLQMLHGVKPAEINTEKVIPGASASEPIRSESDNTKIYNTDNFEIPDAVTMESWEELPSHRRTTSGGGNYQQEPDPVDQVMSGLLQEFLGVTSTEDVGMAKYYITLNEMNVNDAILNYYNDLP
ncbi:uncharacterized protein LOC117343770 [Pecten maximus]|uniref:uncharacterized protein LOC117343770 n=1 Tax=Pecten maximus TaxID=6579 RepID=UPI001457F7F4|nr:uncharacterized protein LOC117343770 [Pecten maximus]XP_033762151.1 uncharacterized protein LOC117343770 [Pecten maximus]XP_033762152.1 uncharacterized protein LOC117343770 [Pecten maximus]